MITRDEMRCKVPIPRVETGSLLILCKKATFAYALTLTLFLQNQDSLEGVGGVSGKKIRWKLSKPQQIWSVVRQATQFVVHNSTVKLLHSQLQLDDDEDGIPKRRSLGRAPHSERLNLGKIFLTVTF